jgi:hypothetical protein
MGAAWYTIRLWSHRGRQIYYRKDRPPQALAPPLTSQDIGTSRWQLGLNDTQLDAYPKGASTSLHGPLLPKAQGTACL